MNSYIYRHWRGELPLAISYWVNGIVLSSALTFLLFLGMQALKIEVAPIAISLGMIFCWLGVVALWVWQSVGVWRSASRSANKVWPVLAKVAVVLGAFGLAGELSSKAIPQIGGLAVVIKEQAGPPPYTIRVLHDGSAIEVSGRITYGLTKTLAARLNQDPHLAATIKTIHLNSVGGRVVEARKLRDYIADRHWDTYSATGCASACVLPFMAGEHRFLGTSAQLGFHQFFFPGINQQDIASFSQEDTDYLSRKGIPERFIDKAMSTPTEKLWTPSREELIQARVIQGEFKDNDMPLSGSGGKDIEQELLRLPLYQSLKQYEPDTYEKVVKITREAYREGKTLGELRAGTLPLIIQVYRRRLPYASDDAVMRFLRVLDSEAKTMLRSNPNACYSYFAGVSQGAIDANRYFTKEQVDEELAVMSEVIESAAIAPRPPTSPELVQRSLNDFQHALIEQFGADLNILSSETVPPTMHSEYCQMVDFTLLHMLKLPTHEGSDLARFIFGKR